MEQKIAKPKILITFREGGENGGPFVSHKRIVESSLKEQYEFIPLMLPAPKKILTLKGIRQLKKQIREYKPDILHFAGLQLEGFAVLFVAKLAGVKKTLCAIRGSSADAINFRGIKRKTMIALENWTLKHSSACYGVSEFVSNWARVKKYAKNNLGYVYNMRAHEKIEKDSRLKMRKEFGIQDDEIIIISTGRIIVDKGFEILLKVILSNQKWDKVKFLIVGDGSYLPEMKDKVRQNGLYDNVIFTGYRNDVMYLLSGSDIFVICTLHETLCNSVIEASDAGLPVVATRTGGIPEIIQDKKTGLLVEANDIDGFKTAVLTLVKNKDLRKDMGQAGASRMKEIFSEQSIAGKLSKIYENLLG